MSVITKSKRYLMAAMTIVLWVAPWTYAASLKGSRPNIILIMADDQGKGDLHCLGNQLLSTPNIDRFYETAMRFSDFHVEPTCAPTRSAIMSGRQSMKNGITHTIFERERMALSVTTFPQLLQKAGYLTAIFGKWHLGDEEPYQPAHRGFDEVFIHGGGGIGQKFKGSCADFPPNRVRPGCYFDNVIRHNDTVVQTHGFCTDVFFQAALGWIHDQHEKGVPFFAYVPLNAPHGPFYAPKKNFKKWKDAGWDDRTAGRYGMIENIDENMGLLMKKFDQWKIWDDSLVIYMSDNGQAAMGSGTCNGKKIPYYTAGFKSGKATPYEGGTSVLAFWRWKGILPEGKDIKSLTAGIDLFDTFCELAGIEVPDKVQKRDGRSMLPLLENPDFQPEDRMIFVHRGRWKPQEKPEVLKYKFCAVRSQRWRFVNNSELYDIANDPFETVNVIEKYPQVVETFRLAYENWWHETRPLMINEGASYSGPAPFEILYENQLAKGPLPEWTAPDLDN